MIWILLVALTSPFAQARLASHWPSGVSSAVNIEGQTQEFSDLKGKKGTMVVFINPRCPFVEPWMGRISTLSQWAQGQNIGVILVSSHSAEQVPAQGPESLKSWLMRFPIKFPVLMDDSQKIAREFGAQRTPEAFVFNEEDALVYHGAIDDNADDEKKVGTAYLKQALDALANHKKAPHKETKFIGCSIPFSKKE